MPQLDTVTFLTQYIWTIVILFTLFFLLVDTILPRLQQLLAIREQSGKFRPEEVGFDFWEIPRAEVLILRSLCLGS